MERFYDRCWPFTAACLLLAALPAAGWTRLLTIARPKAPPVLVIPAAPEDQVRYAVDDLRNYLGQITGQEIADAGTPPAGRCGICIGDVPANADLKPVIARAQLGRDGFVLDIGPRGVRILGGSKFGTAYGIYAFLERLGVRWLFPGDWGEVVPRLATVILPVARSVEKPAFAIREQHCAYVGQPVGDWYRRNRHNRSGFFGHSGLISPAVYGKDHLDWYAEIDGKRQVNVPEYKLCHSNPAMVRQAIADVLEEIRQRKADTAVRVHDGYRHLAGDYFIISISPTDGGGFCRCAACRQLGPVSDRLQVFANTVADAVRKVYPDYQVGYYGAYAEAQEAPTVHARPGVVVFATTWTKSFFAPLAAPANNAFRQKLAAFAAACPNLVLRDFDGLAIWWGQGPFTLADVHAGDYRWYLEHRFQGICTEAHIGWGPWGYSYYLMGKLWWNPHADLAALKRDFVSTGYAEACTPMERYYRRLDAARVYPSSAVVYAMRRDLDEAARIVRRPDARLRIDYLRAYYFLLDVHDRMQAARAAPEELLAARRVCRSIDAYVTGMNAADFAAGPAAPADEIAPLTPDGLHAFLNGIVPASPGRELPAWRDGDDQRLAPAATAGAFPADMGAHFRYGPHTLLIFARANERIAITQQAGATIDFTLRDPLGAVLEQGTSTKEEVIARTAATTGVYTFNFVTMGRLAVANRGAVIKAGGARQCLHPFGRAVLYFYVPPGTREFAVSGRGDGAEHLVMDLRAPWDAKTPLCPQIVESSSMFQEHRIRVPAGLDGTVWQITLTNTVGEDKEIFLLGIPPFLAGDPGRLLIRR